MHFIQPFTWRPLTADGALLYCLDASGALLLRAARERSPAMPPLTAVQWSPGNVERLDARGCVWTRAANGDGWMLHSEALAFAHETARRWQTLLAMASALVAVDERVLSAFLMTDGSVLAPSDDGLVHDVKTRLGYPARRGDADTGDTTRDAQDFAATGGTRALHGLMQISIARARAVCPELFEGLVPIEHRKRLADPLCSVACAAKALGALAPDVRADPIRVRMGSALAATELTTVGTSEGTALADGARLLPFLAMWNLELVSRAVPEPAALAVVEPSNGEEKPPLGIPWIWWAGAAGAACVGLGLSKTMLDQKIADAKDEDDFDDDDDDGEEDDDDLNDPDDNDDPWADATEAPLLLPDSP